MSWCRPLWVHLVLDSLHFLDLYVHFLHQVSEVRNHWDSMNTSFCSLKERNKIISFPVFESSWSFCIFLLYATTFSFYFWLFFHLPKKWYWNFWNPLFPNSLPTSILDYFLVPLVFSVMTSHGSHGLCNFIIMCHGGLILSGMEEWWNNLEFFCICILSNIFWCCICCISKCIHILIYVDCTWSHNNMIMN